MIRRPLAAVVLCVLASSAQARPRCDAETTQGSWVYTCEGTLPTPDQTNTRILGHCSASRIGYFTCEGTANVGTQIVPQTLRGQANTTSICTGTISYIQTLGGYPAAPLDIQYVVSRRGNVIDGLPTNTKGVLSCHLERIGDPPD